MRIDHITTAGTFSLDGKDYDVENNVWLVGDDERVVVIDAPHDAEAIVATIGGRQLDGIVCTHGHNDHINAAVDVAQATGAPIALHPADRMLWEVVHPNRRPEIEIAHGDVLQLGGAQLQVWHTPGHSPGGVCLYLAEAGVIFSGDTLFQGGPGATGRSYSHFPTIIESLRRLLMYMPPDTVVHTGHGDTTTIGAESPHIEEWVKRGH
ncbi:MAG TPA: MBL fold metallo-hydrolase [Acidimicrobiales bacterium]|nr:MBL fold metallo-hydrolase [Acidimicrobiales bacterium]